MIRVIRLPFYGTVIVLYGTVSFYGFYGTVPYGTGTVPYLPRHIVPYRHYMLGRVARTPLRALPKRGFASYDARGHGGCDSIYPQRSRDTVYGGRYGSQRPTKSKFD